MFGKATKIKILDRPDAKSAFNYSIEGSLSNTEAFMATFPYYQDFYGDIAVYVELAVSTCKGVVPVWFILSVLLIVVPWLYELWHIQTTPGPFGQTKGRELCLTTMRVRMPWEVTKHMRQRTPLNTVYGIQTREILLEAGPQTALQLHMLLYGALYAGANTSCYLVTTWFLLAKASVSLLSFSYATASSLDSSGSSHRLKHKLALTMYYLCSFLVRASVIGLAFTKLTPLAGLAVVVVVALGFVAHACSRKTCLDLVFISETILFTFRDETKGVWRNVAPEAVLTVLHVLLEIAYYVGNQQPDMVFTSCDIITCTAPIRFLLAAVPILALLVQATSFYAIRNLSALWA